MRDLSFRLIFGIALIILSCTSVYSQNTDANTVKVVTYAGIVHPIVTISENKPVYNFSETYVVGLPTGINVWKNKKVGFSLEFVPYIRAVKGESKMSNFLFHPGVLFALGKGYTLATRTAFETSGRYGFTPVLNKIIRKNKNTSYFIAVPVPARFGNSQANTIAVAFQFGVTF